MIYFLRAVGGGPITIGYTDNLPARLRQLEYSGGATLAVLAAVDGGPADERAIHARFAHLRLGQSEQFRADADLLAFIDRPTPVAPEPEAAEVAPARSRARSAVAAPGKGRPNPRLDRWARLLARYGRLPGWLQVVLAPWLLPAQSLCFFPIMVPAICGVATLILAYLKWNYLGDMTWRQIAWLSTSPLWLFAAFGYVFLTWTAVGTIPLAVVVFGRQWWEGRPFRLRDPAPDVTDEGRAALNTKLRDGKGLDRDDVRMLVAINEADNRRAMLLLKVCGGSFAVAFIGIAVAQIGFGSIDKERDAILALLWIGTLFPTLFLLDMPMGLRLRCRHCGRTLAGIKLRQVLESDACPACSGPAPLAEGPGASRPLPLD